MSINRRGLIGTLTVHGLILALLIFGGLKFPDPPPEEEGILVNFGIDDTGYGQIEPKGDEANQGNPEPEVSESIPEPVTPAYTPVESTPVDNTQDVEEVKVKEDPQPTAEELKKQREETERIRKEKEAEQIRLAEEARIRREQEAERKRLEEEQRQRDEKANKLNKLGQNTFGRQGVGDQDGSQGVKPGSGTNQGVNTGTPGADNYGDGAGLGNNGNYGLGSRKVIGKLPKPNVEKCDVTSRITITVEIQVDRDGNVVGASIKKASFDDNCITNVVLEAARRTKFTRDPNAQFKQTGWIKYTIEP